MEAQGWYGQVWGGFMLHIDFVFLVDMMILSGCGGVGFGVWR